MVAADKSSAFAHIGYDADSCSLHMRFVGSPATYCVPNVTAIEYRMFLDSSEPNEHYRRYIRRAGITRLRSDAAA